MSIKWRLKEIMARYNIKGVHLAHKLDISANAMSTVRNAKTMPRIDGMALTLLCNALNELAEDLEKPITPASLIDYQQDPMTPLEAEKSFSVIKRRKAKKQQASSAEMGNDPNLKLIAKNRGVA